MAVSRKGYLNVIVGIGVSVMVLVWCFAVLKVQWGSHPDRTLGGPLIFHSCYRSTISMFVRLPTLLGVCPTAALVLRSLVVLSPWKAA